MRAFFAGVALCAGLMATAAQAETPTAKDCARAYVTLDELKSRERELNYQSEKNHHNSNFTGLGRYIVGYAMINFDDRARELEKKYKDQFTGFDNVFGLHLSISHETIDPIMMEASAADLDVLLAPQKLYIRQLPLFALASTCDATFGFTPALPAPPSRVDLALKLKANMDRKTNERLDYLQGLSDVQCTVRLAAAAQLLPAGTPAQQSMIGEYNTGIGKMMASAGSATPDRMKELMQREMMDLSSHLQGKSKTMDDFIEEVHFCEGRFDIPVSDLKVNTPKQDVEDEE